MRARVYMKEKKLLVRSFLRWLGDGCTARVDMRRNRGKKRSEADNTPSSSFVSTRIKFLKCVKYMGMLGPVINLYAKKRGRAYVWHLRSCVRSAWWPGGSVVGKTR